VAHQGLLDASGQRSADVQVGVVGIASGWRLRRGMVVVGQVSLPGRSLRHKATHDSPLPERAKDGEGFLPGRRAGCVVWRRRCSSGTVACSAWMPRGSSPPVYLASGYFGVRVFWCPSILATDVASCRSVPGEDPPMKRFWPLFALVWLAAALPASAGSVPDALTPWVDWVLRDRPDHGCYRLAAEPERRHCLWPGTLEIELTAQGASFRQRWESQAPDQWLALPGDAEHWPRS